MKKAKAPPIKHPMTAARGVLAAIHRAWKSIAAKFPTAKIMKVAQFQKIALGKGDRAA
jgi:hypothetical protein